MYERHTEPVISRVRFFARLVAHGSVAFLLLVGSLAIGMAGYMVFEHLPWRDAFLDAAMLLGGMGPVHSPLTPAGKVFAGVYALYAGLVFIVTAGLLLAPAVHRVLHRLHWTDDD